MAETMAWADAPHAWPLGRNEVHVWLAAPAELEADAEHLAPLLAPDERERATRYRLSTGRSHFIVERGTLRLLLSSYLGILPAALRLRYGPHGKPYLADGPAEGSLRFNLSHSHDWALYAFTWGFEVGVDIERLREHAGAERIAARYFSASERAALRALPQHEREPAFFRCWTRKEAYVKAVGGGISMSLSGFDVSLAPGEPARLLSVAGQPDAAARWSLSDLPPIPGYASALAVETQGLTIRSWRWTQSSMRRTLGALPWL